MTRGIGYYSDWNCSWKDAGGEIGTSGGAGPNILVEDDDGSIGTNDALFQTFKTAANALLLGAPAGDRYALTHVVNPATPTNGAAREIKLQVFYRSTATGKPHTITFPTVNLTAVTYINNVGAKDALSMTTPAPVVTFINAFQAFVRDPDWVLGVDGVPVAGDGLVTVVGLKVVGRNN